jgi:hypothetical protein
MGVKFYGLNVNLNKEQRKARKEVKNGRSKSGLYA